MTPLEGILIRRIRAEGPMTVAEYMSTCLLHPQHGFYMTGDPLGRDFTTSPEISQMFGELIGLALAQAWLDQGRPTQFYLVELGPGRGTLMADILRAAEGVPGWREAAEVHLVEASPVLRTRQAKTIPGAINHHDSLTDLPDGPIFLVANEFFDALPVRQFLREGDAWRERVVGIHDDTLSFGLAPPSLPPFLDPRLADTKDGDMVEYSPTLSALAGEIGARIDRSGGLALIIDYGSEGEPGDTLQAIRQGEKVPPLDGPGTSDLTAHVDFHALSKAAHPAQASAITAQGVFLERLGITARAQALARRGDPNVIATQHRRLTHPGEMGSLFKVLALTRADAPAPPGFE